MRRIRKPAPFKPIKAQRAFRARANLASSMITVSESVETLAVRRLLYSDEWAQVLKVADKLRWIAVRVATREKASDVPNPDKRKARR